MTETCEKKGAAKVAFVGLGVMGYPMAGHLKRAGHDVVVFNRTHAKAEKWVAEHGDDAVRSGTRQGLCVCLCRK